MRLKPQSPRCRKWVDSRLAPPLRFIAIAMQLMMMPAAQRNRELIADLAPECPALREAQVMGIARPPAFQFTPLAIGPFFRFPFLLLVSIGVGAGDI